MSGVFIRGMEMPTTGLYLVGVDNSCGKDETVITVRRMLGSRDMCLKVGAYNLFPVSDHGRLIDADELYSVLKWHHSVFIGAEDEVEKAQSDALICAMSEVVNAPTIIPAEEAET